VDIAMPGPDPSRSALIIVDRLLGYGRLPCVRGHPEPAIIAICGMGPVNFALSDPSQPGVRRLAGDNYDEQCASTRMSG
jgi:hypothetical protein